MSDFKLVLILGCMAILTLAVMAQFPEIFADIDTDIEKQKQKMSDYEKLAEQKKSELRKAKADEGKSWSGTEKVISVQKELDDLIKSVQEARKVWLDLLKQKSNEIKQKKLADEVKKKQEKQLRIDNKNKFSNLVKIIGVDLSESCIKQIRNNYTTDCPTYRQLRQLDVSRQEVSGHFIVENGFYHRDVSPLKNSWRYYDKDPTLRIIVDPPAGMSERIKLITIQNNFDTYLLPDSREMKQSYVFVNVTNTPDAWGRNSTYFGLNKTVSVQVPENFATRIIYHDRYVDDSCHSATINAKKWKELLPDTIDYMRNNCDEKHTAFNDKEVVLVSMTPQDITTSQKWKDEQRLKWIKENCLKKYQACK